MFVNTVMDSRYQNHSIFLSLENNYDEELSILWMHKHYYVPWISCVLYTLFVLVIHRWMKYRPPVEFGTLILPTWNGLFAICNLLVFVKVAPTRLNVLWELWMDTLHLSLLFPCRTSGIFGIVFSFCLN